MPESALYQAVDAVADRVNYGLEAEDIVKVFSEHPPRSLILPSVSVRRPFSLKRRV